MIQRALGDGWEVDAARDEARAIGLKTAAPEEFATSYISSHRQ